MLFIEGKLVEFSTVVPQTEREKKRLGDVLVHTCVWAKVFQPQEIKKKKKRPWILHFIDYYLECVCECLDSSTFSFVFVVHTTTRLKC